jgi:hypothetical protein
LHRRRQPSLLDESLSLRREIGIRERLKLAFTADVFNITNSACFAAPGTNIDSPQFAAGGSFPSSV